MLASEPIALPYKPQSDYYPRGSDQFAVELDADTSGLPWRAAYGGGRMVDEVGRVHFEDLVLERFRSDQSAGVLAQLMMCVGRMCRVKIAHLDYDINQTGAGLVYQGRITMVKPGTLDASRDEVVIDRVYVTPHRCDALKARDGEHLRVATAYIRNHQL